MHPNCQRSAQPMEKSDWKTLLAQGIDALHAIAIHAQLGTAKLFALRGSVVLLHPKTPIENTVATGRLFPLEYRRPGLFAAQFQT